MGTLIFRWFLSRKVRQAVDMCRQARKLIKAQRDVLSASAIDTVMAAIAELKQTIMDGQEKAALEAPMAKLEKSANENLKSYPSAVWRENVEVLLVTGAVVLALRTFFFQPMAIPSGSAQPTLWGITSENLKERPGREIPRGLKRIIESCWLGIHYYHIVARADGELTRIEPPKLVFPFVKKQTIWVGNEPYSIWFPPENLDDDRHASLHTGQFFRQGEDIIRLKVTSGDHLFVDRLTYNFRHPRRGEIIVFESTGIPGIIQNTHYIKRLIALSGEKVRISNDRHVYINGQRLDASTPGFENVYGFNPKEPARADHYSGHVNNETGRKAFQANHLYPSDLAGLFLDGDAEFTVRPDHYLAFGDNTMNSNDGRNWGDFPREKVIGKAWFVFWPITERFGWGFR